MTTRILPCAIRAQNKKRIIIKLSRGSKSKSSGFQVPQVVGEPMYFIRYYIFNGGGKVKFMQILMESAAVPWEDFLLHCPFRIKTSINSTPNTGTWVVEKKVIKLNAS